MNRLRGNAKTLSKAYQKSDAFGAGSVAIKFYMLQNLFIFVAEKTETNISCILNIGIIAWSLCVIR